MILPIWNSVQVYTGAPDTFFSRPSTDGNSCCEKLPKNEDIVPQRNTRPLQVFISLFARPRKTRHINFLLSLSYLSLSVFSQKYFTGKYETKIKDKIGDKLFLWLSHKRSALWNMKMMFDIHGSTIIIILQNFQAN